MKIPSQTCKKRRQQDVRDKCHSRNVHIGRIEIIARWEEVIGVSGGILGAGRGRALLTRPGLMPPWKEYKE